MCCTLTIADYLALNFFDFSVPTSTQAEGIGQKLPLEISADCLKLAAQ